MVAPKACETREGRKRPEHAKIKKKTNVTHVGTRSCHPERVCRGDNPRRKRKYKEVDKTKHAPVKRPAKGDGDAFDKAAVE